MRGKSKQFEPIQNVMSKSVENIELVKKRFTDSIKWLKNAKKQLNKILDCTNALTHTPDLHLHPQIHTNTYSTFSQLSNVASNFQAFLSETIPMAKSSINDTSAKISSIRSQFRSQHNSLISIHDELYSMLLSPNKSSNSQEYLEHGFHLHCQYLRYFNQITEIQDKIIKTLNETKELINLIKEAEKSLVKKLNNNALKTFPVKKELMPMFEKNANNENNENMYDNKNEIKEVNESFEEQREPQFRIADEFRFEDAKIEMEVLKGFNKVEQGQIDIVEGEIVTVIDSNFPEYWTVKKANGIEGEVPALCLIPKQKQA
ncbi:hypothetical protein TRFO_05114 [Tritrichomonas foetus]|uniref:SH3 domain-containing protein n=1 Tax=Tritrichomonas foetus TaxID=1144522 RepID=A0A1J4KAP4_9EUKA|nr:hypothetical protein TRFO_05114 [Tritrichomonas foetus]|eukprot:OHT07968.1 hypothetical protein TRFO_05114 [Tritrichomonas foetus]